MRRELACGLAAIAALALGATCAQGYSRLAAPYYAAVARAIAIGHPWTIRSVTVEPNDLGPGVVLKLDAEVRERIDDTQPAALVVARVHVGEAIEGPVVFWTMLLLWPAASLRQRLVNCAAGLPVFMVLEAVTTGVQLMHNLPETSAILAGERDPFTVWERWSRFLEGGGHFVVEACGAMLAAVIGTRRGPIDRRVPSPVDAATENRLDNQVIGAARRADANSEVDLP